MELYTRRFEEGYNVFLDSDYISWLKLYHPESFPPEDALSLTDAFSSVTPISVVGTKQPSHDITQMNELTVSTYTKSDTTVAYNGSAVTPQAQTPPGNTRNSASSGNESTVSKYLISPAVTTPGAKKPAPRARLLTSSDSLAQLEEKERKKREDQELKEQKK